ncbi:uncharacterized protein BDR25DRAFT_241960, partial [Lindgomyces ingoldianus]
ASLRSELGEEHEFEFVQGTIEWPMASGLEPISNPNETYYAYFEYTPESALAAVEALERYISVEGPFDGILAFSQGAGLAIMFLLRYCSLPPQRSPLFKCALLFSPTGMYDPVAWINTGTIQKVDTTDRVTLTIASIVVWGEQDLDGVSEDSGVAARLFDSDMVWIHVHNRGHEIPSAASVEAFRGMMRYIRRAITLARVLAHSDRVAQQTHPRS